MVASDQKMLKCVVLEDICKQHLYCFNLEDLSEAEGKKHQPDEIHLKPLRLSRVSDVIHENNSTRQGLHIVQNTFNLLQQLYQFLHVLLFERHMTARLCDYFVVWRPICRERLDEQLEIV